MKERAKDIVYLFGFLIFIPLLVLVGAIELGIKKVRKFWINKMK
jgi:hypothetical protein